ncbi:MAG TPA: TolC family protein [Anseongella sp.]
MKKAARILLTIGTSIIFSGATAQELFTLEDAIRTGLENNYSIKISAGEEEIATTNLDIAKSVLFPSLELTGGASGRSTNSDLTFFDGREQNRKNAKSNSYNAALNLDWTIFDGFGMFASLDKYQELKSIGTLNGQLTVLNTVSDIIATYYDIVRLQQELHSIAEALEISRLRVEQANDRYFVGTGSKLELLNSRVDFNEDTSSFISQQEAVKTAKTRLNEILSRDLSTPFLVTDTILIDMDLRYSDLRNKIISDNPQLAIAQSQKKVAQLEYKEIRANRYPTISLNSSYNFIKSDAESGQVLSNQTYGLNYGITASMNIFSGFLQKKQERNARIIVDNQQLAYEQLLQTVESALTIAFSNYENAKVLMKLEEENREVAQQNLDITLEMFRLGNITQLELREAQQNLLLAENRYIDAKYKAKLAEISLRELSGSF